jgi:hypothetical protein
MQAMVLVAGWSGQNLGEFSSGVARSVCVGLAMVI